MTHGISWFGAVIVTMNLLRRSKKGQKGHESFAEKIARDNFGDRVNVVRRALNTNKGTTVEAAQAIKNIFFTDVKTDTLVGWLSDEVGKLSGSWKPINAPKASYGDLDFDAAASWNSPPAVNDDDDLFLLNEDEFDD